MRRFALTTIALLGLAAPGAALAQGTAQPPAQPPAQAPAQPAAPAAADAPEASEALAQSLRADLARIPHRGPLHERGRRSGALPALPGPARRAAVLELPLLVRQAGRHVGLPRARRERRLPRPGVHGELRPDRQAVAQRQLAADSAVLQRRYDDAVYGHRRHAGARRRDAARDPERPGQSQRLRPARAGSSNCASGATSAVSTWSRRRSRTSTSRPASRRRSTAASCPGEPASASATTSRWRSPTIRARTTSPSAPSGRTRATCCVSPTAAPGSRTSRRR